MGSMDTAIPRRQISNRDYLSGAFAWLLVFFVVYFARPEEVIPMGTFPIAKVSGLLAIASFGLVVMARPKLLTVPWEMRYLIFLTVWFWIGVPISPIWKGGAYVTTLMITKMVPIALLIGVVANNVRRLKKLIFVQTASVLMVVVVTLIAFRFHATEDKRLTGSLNGIYGNPNDLALCIVLVFPFCTMFMLSTTNIIKKMFWLAAMILMGFALLLTYSRAGVVALVASGFVMVWEFGVRGRRHGFLIMVGFMALCITVIAGPKGYFKRLASVFDPALDAEGDKGSWQARKELLILSIKTTLQHPLLGVGAGNFQVISDWHVTHNSYTELSAEGGIPALIIYLLIIRRTFINLREAQVLARGHPDLQLLDGALRVSFAAFIVGSFFDSVAYNYFPYFLIAYTGALLKISKARSEQSTDLVPLDKKGSAVSGSKMNGVLGKRSEVVESVRGSRTLAPR
jgi:hypothetical protein